MNNFRVEYFQHTMQKRLTQRILYPWILATLIIGFSVFNTSCDLLTTNTENASTAEGEEGEDGAENSDSSEETESQEPQTVVDSFTSKLRDSFNKQKQKLEQTISPGPTEEELAAAAAKESEIPELEEPPEPTIQPLPKEWLPAGVSRGSTNPDEAIGAKKPSL